MENPRTLLIISLICLAFAIGLSAREAFRSDPIPVQQASQFKECFAATTWWLQGEDNNRGDSAPDYVRVPEGFVPIGGAGGDPPMIVFCR